MTLDNFKAVSCDKQLAVTLSELASETSYVFKQDEKLLHQQCEKKIRAVLQESRIYRQLRERNYQQREIELKNEIKAYRQSTSWRVTRPLREAVIWWRRFIRHLRTYESTQLPSYPTKTNSSSKFSAHEFDLLKTHLGNGLILKPIVLFDHNLGGGSNVYTRDLVKYFNGLGIHVLRVYCCDEGWFIEWHGDGMLYFSPSMAELFHVLSLSKTTNVIVNSLYGWPNISNVVPEVISLVRALGATLDIKMHDFYSLCPSPHLLNHEEKYCGVPQDIEVCSRCLKKQPGERCGQLENYKPVIDIAKWREPFASLFDAASTISFFDPSSVDIAHKAFKMGSQKINIVPHVSKHFESNGCVDLLGPLHIGVLGRVDIIKGGDVVKALYNYINEKGLDIPITVVGGSVVDLPVGISVLGKYEQCFLPTIIHQEGINVFLMPAIIPETFSYTISEAMEMGLPIVAFDIGAQGHRVKQYQLGKVVPLGSSPEVILTAIQTAFKTAQELVK